MTSREVSAMIKQGFIPDPTLSLSFSPSRTTLSRLYSLSSSPPAESTRPSHNNPPLFEMMSEENLRGSKSMEESRRRTQRRVDKFLTELNAYSFKNGGLGPSDVRLTVVSRDGQRVPMDVHGRALSEKRITCCLEYLEAVPWSEDEEEKPRTTKHVKKWKPLFHAYSDKWIVDILLEKRMANDFVKLWADQRELSELHSKIPTMYRNEITAQLCIAIGRGNRKRAGSRHGWMHFMKILGG